MRNRVAVCGITLLLTLVVAGFFGWSINATTGVVFLILAVTVAFCTAKHGSKRASVAMLLLFCAGAGFLMMSVRQHRIESALNVMGEGQATLTGYVCDLPEYDGKYRYTVCVEIANGAEIESVKIELVSEGSLHAQLYDRVDGVVCVYPAERVSDGVAAYAHPTADGELIFTPSQKRDVRYYICRAREKIIAGLDSMFIGDTLGFVKGVLLGDASDMSEQTYLQFRESGLSHVIVVSGMHMTVVSGAILYGLRLLTGLRRKWCAIIAMLPIAVFMGLVGFTPSVLRAGIAMIVHLTAMIFDEDTDCLRSLGWAVILIAIYDPTVVTGAGFLLSVFAVLGIDIVGTRLIAGCKDMYYKRFRREPPRLTETLIQTASVTVGATLMTLPLCAVFFPRVSVISIVANLLIFFAVDIILVVGLVMMLALLAGFERLALISGLAVGLSAKYCIAVINWLTDVFATTVPTYEALTVIAGLACAAVMILCLFTRKLRAGFITCTAIVLAVSVCHTATSRTAVRLTVTESGCFIRDKEGVISVIGFDDVYSAEGDLSQMIYTYDVDRFGLVVWNDLSELDRLLRLRGAECVVTDKREVAASSMPDSRLIYDDAQLTLNGVRYESKGSSVLIKTGQTSVEVLLKEGDEPCSETAAVVVRRVAEEKSEAVTEILLRQNTLATKQTSVYNSEREWYSVTIFDNGFYWIEKG